ncbi:hypothetical protein [Streptomyces tsukubensis]|uniref:hypothetical protein n=1 Tax=Streptomyces tsukubensis TaxID=83656 RepID=UPI00344F6DD6
MTETEQTDWSDVDQAPAAPAVAYPQFPDNPHNHRYTVSVDGRGPMVVIRGNTAAEINAACEELTTAATGAAIGSFWSAFKAAGVVANGLGGATPVPAGPPAPPVPLQQSPQAQYPQPAQMQPGVPGTAPAAWQNVGAPPSEYAQAGWMRLDVPFPQKAAFEAIVAQYQMRKGRPSENGQYSWNKGDRSGVKGWHIHPQYTQAFGQFTPVPA